MCKDFEKEMNEYEKKRETKRQAFLKKGVNKIKDNGSLVYKSLALYITDRYDIYSDFKLPTVVYELLNHYIDNVDEDFEEWLHKDNSPLIRKSREIPKIFPEITEITTNKKKIVEIANNIYGLNLEYYTDYYDTPYLFSLEFDFNSFTPININEIKQLKEEIKILKKHNVDTEELELKLSSYGLTSEQIDEL